MRNHSIESTLKEHYTFLAYENNSFVCQSSGRPNICHVPTNVQSTWQFLDFTWCARCFSCCCHSCRWWFELLSSPDEDELYLAGDCQFRWMKLVSVLVSYKDNPRGRLAQRQAYFAGVANSSLARLDHLMCVCDCLPVWNQLDSCGISTSLPGVCLNILYHSRLAPEKSGLSRPLCAGVFGWPKLTATCWPFSFGVELWATLAASRREVEVAVDQVAPSAFG